MSVIVPAASTAAGVAVSEDTAADGALFAALVADASGTQASATTETAPTIPVDVVAPDSDAPATDTAASGWLLAPVPLIPSVVAEAPTEETTGADFGTDAPVAPPIETLPATPANEADASAPAMTPTPTPAPDQQLNSAPHASTPAPTVSGEAPMEAEAATPAETSAPAVEEDGAPAVPSKAETLPAPAQAKSPVAPSAALAAALVANRATAAAPAVTAEAPPQAESVDPAPAPSASPSSTTTQAAAAPVTAPPAAAPPTPPAAPRSRDANGRGEDRPSNAARATTDSATPPASAPAPSASTPSATNGAAMAASFAAATPRGEQITTLPASPGDAPASTEGDAAAPAALPPLDSQVGAPAANRDLGLSMLSRATVETTAQIAAQILKKLDGRSTRFDMALTPEDLGRVDVSMEIDSDGRLTARLAFDNPAAATDLRGRADELRRQLQEAGFQLSQDSLEFAERNPSSGFGGGAFDRPPDRRAFAGAARIAADADLAAPPPGAWTSLSLTRDRVDLKV